jgi:hypothetical protein
MSRKNHRVRRATVGFLVLLGLAVGAQAAVPQRVTPSAVEFFNAILPAGLRAWLPSPPAAAHRAPRRPLPLKCGGTIDPDGHCSHAACAGCG